MTQVKRRVFFSFHYDNDAWRVQEIRNAGVLDGNQPIAPNNWEEVKRGGDRAIRNWIDGQLETRSCLVVFIGSDTASRRWIHYEIDRAWELGKGVVGIHIHQLLDADRNQARQGQNPFVGHTIENRQAAILAMNDVVKAYISSSNVSRTVYGQITGGLPNWVEEAIQIRAGYPR